MTEEEGEETMKTIKIIDLLCYISISDYDKLPKKVRYEEINWKLEINSYCGVDYSDETQYMFADYIDKHFYIQEILNDEVTILDEELDEEDEFEDIEHYDMFDYFGGYDFGGTNKELLCDLQSNFEHINNELDKLIKNQKKIIERLKDGE